MTGSAPPAPEWRRLLSSVPVGRLGFTVGALPEIRPVPLLTGADGALLTCVDAETAEHVRPGTIVALQADAWDVGLRRGWTVTVVGVCVWPPADASLTAEPGGQLVRVDVATVRHRVATRAWGFTPASAPAT
ncbi:pyridoxamine 5'-phosphate oxidase family protein [Modestobacter sp. NPDC049651]|uniref:pyridoxamine 5'-phosphate oxidase family protein n=1 Tax=unclassified Modestobacter TaxID=2643866 RepID=UPI003401CEE6